MQPAAIQPELYTYSSSDNLTGFKDRVFAPVCILNHRYYLEKFPQFYFIVRKDKYCMDPSCERVCLYREGVVNQHLKGDEEPFTLWVSNELRENRRIEAVYREMEQKAESLTVRNKYITNF